MIMTDKTITLFCPYESNGETVYARTVIHGVSWYQKNAAAITTNGLKSADVVDVRIPVAAFPSQFINHAAYGGQGWTLHEGMVVCAGEVAETAPAGLVALYGREIVKTVLSFTDNRRGWQPHMKVVLT